MNIAFYLNKISFGGGERVRLMLMDEFFKRGHTITIFTSNREMLKSNLPHDIIVFKKSEKVNQHIFDIFKIGYELKKRKIDCLILFGIVESFIISSFFIKTKSIVSLRVDPRFAKNKFVMRLRSEFCFLLSNGVVFQTEKVQRYFSKNARSKSVVIPNPIIDDSLLIPKKDRKHKIVAVGRLSQEKNYPMLIEAFSNIDHGDYTLHIYGEGPLRCNLNSLILSLGMRNKVILEGYVERVVDEISDAEIFVLFSNLEGMPNALIEAMSMGLACISTNFPSGAAEELIRNNENGILVPVGDQKQLEKSISLLINDKELCLKLRNNSPKVRDFLRKGIIINQWTSYIKQMMHYPNNL